MLIFIVLSSILLMGSLTGLLSNSFSRVIQHAREEYLYVYSVYVLEASTSNRLTHFYRKSPSSMFILDSMTDPVPQLRTTSSLSPSSAH